MALPPALVVPLANRTWGRASLMLSAKLSAKSLGWATVPGQIVAGLSPVGQVCARVENRQAARRGPLLTGESLLEGLRELPQGSAAKPCPERGPEDLAGQLGNRGTNPSSVQPWSSCVQPRPARDPAAATGERAGSSRLAGSESWDPRGAHVTCPVGTISNV